MALLLGIDLGTSYFKVGLFDAAGELRGLGRVAVDQRSPHADRRELPVDDFWRRLRSGLAEALAQARAEPRDIAGLSYSSQANTFVLLDARDEPLTPLIIWNDRRADPLEPEVAEFGATDLFRSTTGFSGLAAEFAPAKWRWFQQHKPETWAKAARVMTLSDYLTFALTGERVGDAGTTAFTGAFATARGEWWAGALDFFGLQPAQLSRPLPPGSPAGRTGSRATDLLGLPAGISFAVGTLDHHAAAVGSGIGRLGEASISTGTVLAALTLVSGLAPVAGAYHGAHTGRGRFFRLAFDPAGANQLEDYRRISAPQFSVEQLVALAAEIPAGARGRLPGDRQHGVVIREMMERISAMHRLLLQRVQGARPFRRVIATGGGARSAAWLQINADMLNLTVVAPRSPERACLGAAAFAAVAAGMHPGLEEALAAMVHADRVVEPKPGTVELYASQRGQGLLPDAF